VGFDRPFGCRMVIRLDLAVLEGRTPCEQRAVSFCDEGMFPGEVERGCCSEIERCIVFLSS
jgi:hypothetical protein